MNSTVADRAWIGWADSLLAREQIARIVSEQLLRKATFVDWFIVGTLCAAYSKDVN